MNFLPVKVTATAIEQVQVELPNRQQVWLPVDSANVQVGSNMSLGIRPEHLLPSDIADVTLEGEVQVVEQLVTKHKFTSRSPPSVKTWSTARMTWCW
jgi:multiple sugar transport system ATP-binding protein